MTESKKNVLLVEDEALIAIVETRILERNGYRVKVATSGEQAIEFLEQNLSVDIILMDINLGIGLDGTETAEIILQNYDIPIIFLSSHTEPEVVEKTERITSYGYIVKDSGEYVLLAAIKMAFKLFQAKRQEKQKEKALINRDTYLQKILQTARDGFWAVKSDWTILEVNKAYCQLTGFLESELLGRDLMLTGLFNDQKTLDTLEFKLKEQGFYVLETRIRNKANEYKDLEVSISALSSEEQTYIGFCRDITEKKFAEKEIEKLHTEKEYLLKEIQQFSANNKSSG